MCGFLIRSVCLIRKSENLSENLYFSYTFFNPALLRDVKCALIAASVGHKVSILNDEAYVSAKWIIRQILRNGIIERK